MYLRYESIYESYVLIASALRHIRYKSTGWSAYLSEVTTYLRMYLWMKKDKMNLKPTLIKLGL